MITHKNDDCKMVRRYKAKCKAWREKNFWERLSKDQEEAIEYLWDRRNRGLIDPIVYWQVKYRIYKNEF